MAESAVYSVLAKLADPVIRALIDETLFLYGVRDKVDWLQRELRWMECFLKDAVAKRRSGNELIKNWLREVREVAHEAEDIIDSFTLKSQKKRGLLRRTKRYAAFPCNLISLHMFGWKIQGFKEKIDNIKLSRERYGLVNLAETTPSSSSAVDETLQTRRRIYPHRDHSTLVVGNDVHRKEIADRLLDPNNKRRSVVTIVGTGGLGKTTLANNVYNDSRIKENFQAFACITVSQDYKVHEILKVIVKQMMGKTMAELQSKDVDELAEMLRDFLLEKRYLIVLDDVWSIGVWDHLKRAALPEENNGSRMMLTTRNMDLATSIDPTIPPYKLPFLNDDNSWTLFLNKAFPYRGFSEPIRCLEELEEIGRRLVKRCGGLPLALEVLGGILSSKEPNSAAWKRVAEHFDWSSTDDGGDCSKILGLSYDNLPHHHLKSCFLYLGVFPEDSVIEAQQLIELWIAEGFLPHELEPQLMEDRAHAYLEELANRSMIQVVDKVLLGSSAASSVSTLRIHDLFRDLCVREAREDDLFNIYNTTTSNSSTTDLQDAVNNHGKNLRRLVIHGDISTTTTPSHENCVKDLMLPRNLKSILQFGQKTSSIIIPNGLKLLRVIHFVAMDNEFTGFPEIFGKMRHLRYLRLSGPTFLGSVPPCIRNLCNLQTLDLSGYIRFLLPLPDWLVEMRTLRHLYFNGIVLNVSCLADGGGRLDVEIDASEGTDLSGLEKLVNVQILKVKNLPRGEEEQWRVFIDSLRKMKHLSYLQVRGEMIPIEIFSVLSENTQLREMTLWGSMTVRQLPQSLLHGFPPNLTTLHLYLSELAEDPMATLEKLPYLSVLQLWDNAYTGKEMVCTSGGFPRLQELELRGLYALEEWRVEDGAMPNLTVLHIKSCTKLRTLPEGLQHLRSLRTLNLWKYPVDRVRREVGEDWYKIQHVPQIRYIPILGDLI